ncbi:TAXI family TRAP transporter solute-binding subunit [Vibrio rhizosphaerae]|uniref:TAXI family TRAP transporter solute-binding subunit n=1 Tax=Vibrio rhizosphaerae TaxID=398736 RepID=A0ABU4IYH0_9VIBR|nr:TAXI family TRAP transporter solute-binding subunit [Vibrio rhizosphaerae]MDW6094334.1 TAXI family TRAP transporter solute-binding subunit [Vibrio rhizosphaerae]
MLNNKLKKAAKIMTLSTLLVTGLSHAATSTIISQPPGNGWYTYGTTFSQLIPKATHNEYKIKLIPRGGGMTNPVVVNQGKADFGFTTSNATVWARDGLTEIYKGKKNQNLRIVLDDVQQAYTITIARKSWVEETGNDTLEKIIHADHVRIAMKPTGSQVPIIADYIFRSLGTDLKTLKDEGKVVQMGSGQAAQMMRDNAIDVYIDNVPAMHPNLTEMTLTNDVVYIPYSDKVLKDLAKVGLPTGTMPAGTYDGQSKDYITPVSATVFITNANVDEKTVYNVTKALVENQQEIKHTHSPLKFWHPENIGQHAELVSLHPGAAKYYREKGWLK